ncbi:MAG: rod shape-determining protein MreD [Halanaerobiales bacterium]|nr:rod shape-determining protein MreD [Halanaerobiales bacterium]
MLFAIVLQSTFFILVRPLGVIPDLLMIVVICGALLRGSLFGIQLGLGAGILLDLLLGNFGVNTLLKIIVGYLAGLLEGKIFKNHIIIPMMIVFIMTFVHEFLFLFLSEQLIFSISPLWALKAKIFPLAITNLVCIIPIYPSLYLLEKKIYYY